MMHRAPLYGLILTGVLCWSMEAVACCGLYISSDEDAELLDEATQVVLMRDGTHTAMTIQSSYRGPARDFAMIIPVPHTIEEEDVWVVDTAAFERLTHFTIPHMVEHTAHTSCRGHMGSDGWSPVIMSRVGLFEQRADELVSVKARFSKSEYDLVTLESSDSTLLMEWLVTHGYTIPAQAKDVLKDYMDQGMQFLVARVAIERVNLNDEGRATLSPLHLSYRSEDFTLPIKLGLSNARGPQDLVVHIISKQGRFEVANHTTAIMPTNLLIQNHVRHQFDTFYDALLSHVMTLFNASVMTEYASLWPSHDGQCNPCRTGARPLSAELFGALGVKELHHTINQPTVKMSLAGPGEDDQDLSLVFFGSASNTALCYRRWLARHDLSDSSHQLTQMLTYTRGEDKQWEHEEPEPISPRYPPGSASLPAPVCSQTRQFKRVITQHASKLDKVFVKLTYTHDLVPDEQTMALREYTITRLHMRFSPEDSPDDLIFTPAPALQGGTGIIYPGMRDINFFYTLAHDETPTRRGQRATPNRFQTRHILLDDSSIASTTCPKGTSRHFGWGQPVYVPITHTPDRKPNPLPEEIMSWVKNARKAGLLSRED